MNTIQLQTIPAGDKFTSILNSFSLLRVSESLIIESDHDPIDIQQHLLNTSSDPFFWEYIENGPFKWQVKLTKVRQDFSALKVGEIVAANYQTAAVFKKHNIDFCCKGYKTIAEACSQKGIDPAQVIEELDHTLKNKKHEQDFDSLSLSELIDFIIEKHHTYVNTSIPVINEFLNKVVKVHGESHPELHQIADAFHALAFELQNHMPKEEMILFPYINKIEMADKEGTGPVNAPFGSIINPIRMMEAEHTNAGEALSIIRNASNQFTIPEGACTTFRVVYQLLEEFETYLHEHVHLENNILFLKAIELEQRLTHA